MFHRGGSFPRRVIKVTGHPTWMSKEIVHFCVSKLCFFILIFDCFATLVKSSIVTMRIKWNLRISRHGPCQAVFSKENMLQFVEKHELISKIRGPKIYSQYEANIRWSYAFSKLYRFESKRKKRKNFVVINCVFVQASCIDQTFSRKNGISILSLHRITK